MSAETPTPLYEPIKGWMGVEDAQGRVLLTTNPEDTLLGEPFAVYRKVER